MQDPEYYYEEEDEEEQQQEEETAPAGSLPQCNKCGQGVLLKVRVFEGNTYYGCTCCSSIFGLMTFDNGQTRVLAYGKGLRMEEMEIRRN